MKLIRTRLLLPLLAALFLTVGLTACGGGGGGPAGSYKMTKMNAAGVEMNIEDLAAMAGVDMTVTLDMSALGTGSNVSGTWTASGNTVTLSSEGEDIAATLNGNTLVMEQDGQSLTFEKQ